MFCHEITSEPLFSVALNCWLSSRITWNIKKNQKTKTKKQFSGFTRGDSDLIAMEWDSDGGIFQKYPRSISHAVKIKNHWYV